MLWNALKLALGDVALAVAFCIAAALLLLGVLA